LGARIAFKDVICSGGKRGDHKRKSKKKIAKGQIAKERRGGGSAIIERRESAQVSSPAAPEKCGAHSGSGERSLIRKESVWRGGGMAKNILATFST